MWMTTLFSLTVKDFPFHESLSGKLEHVPVAFYYDPFSAKIVTQGFRNLFLCQTRHPRTPDWLHLLATTFDRIVSPVPLDPW